MSGDRQDQKTYGDGKAYSIVAVAEGIEVPSNEKPGFTLPRR